MSSTGGGDGRSSESYFTDFRKGEVNELLEQLRAASMDKPGGLRQVDVVKKVVAYMTLGIDVSRLFPQMVMATNTRDLVQKKLVYLYLCAYAESHPELSLLAMNTLQKDFLDDNPMVRGLALRSLCSLRLPNLVEYVFNSIQKGIGDLSPYVRKTAVLGCAKLFQIAPTRVRESGIITKLYEMIRDKDAVVVSNCILALNEILADEGGIAINQAIIYHLLNRLKEFNEWTTCVILETASKYNPTEEEVYDVLNILDDRLKHANTAVVFSSAKLFLKFTETLPQLHAQVYDRLKAPLLTAAGGSPELSYVALQHMQLLLGRSPHLFENEFKFFYIKANDPLYLKMLKVQLLTQITSEKNKHEITDELCEYVTDIDVDLAKSAIKAVGHIAIRVEAIASRAVDKLLGFLDLEIDYVTNVTLVVMRDLLRKYPQMANIIIPEIKKCLKSLDDPEAKTAVVWMLGEYGAVIEDSPYLLEALIPNFAEEPPAVRLQLLTSTMKLFFKRPPECRPILGNLLTLALADSSNADVRDRALFYYRLLTVGVDEAKTVIDAAKLPIHAFIEDDAHEYKDQLFEQFNTLSVVYGKPSSLWLKEAPAPVAAAQAEAQAAQNGDAAAPEEEEEEEAGPLQLVLQPVLDPKSFQSKWVQFPERGTIEVEISATPVLNIVETQMSNRSIRCVASGDVGDQMKFYFYAQQVGTSSYFLVETVIEKSKSLLTAKFKGEDDNVTMQFMDYFENAITTVIP